VKPGGERESGRRERGGREEGREGGREGGRKGGRKGEREEFIDHQ
jgi:hypothetical protein